MRNNNFIQNQYILLNFLIVSYSQAEYSFNINNLKLNITSLQNKQTKHKLYQFEIIIKQNNLLTKESQTKQQRSNNHLISEHHIIYINPNTYYPHIIVIHHRQSYPQMLTFDKDTIQFIYIQKSHLKSSLTITNHNDQFVFYKFKITQPKYYLIKQQKGTIKPKQTIVIDITLHKDGIPTAGYDKIKCFYISTDHQLTQQPQNFQRRSDTQTHKFTIKVNDLPQGLQKMPTEMKQSSVKSVQRSQTNFGKTSKNIDSLSLQKQIQQKEEQIVKIKNEMSTIRSTMQKTEVTYKPEPLGALVIWAVMGLVIGVVVGVWWL